MSSSIAQVSKNHPRLTCFYKKQSMKLLSEKVTEVAVNSIMKFTKMTGGFFAFYWRWRFLCILLTLEVFFHSIDSGGFFSFCWRWKFFFAFFWWFFPTSWCHKNNGRILEKKEFEKRQKMHRKKLPSVTTDSKMVILMRSYSKEWQKSS